jgi:hypothetical protein
MDEKPGRPWARRLGRRIGRRRRVAGEVLRREGYRRLGARATAAAAGLFYRRVVVTAVDLRRPLPDAPAIDGVATRYLGAEDAAAYARHRGVPSAAAVFAQRLARGDRASSVWRDGEIVSTGWISFGSAWLADPEQTVRLADGEAFGYDSYTTEASRGRSLASARSYWSLRRLQDEGVTRVVGWIVPENQPAFGPPERMGFALLGNAGFVRLGPWRRYFVHPRGGSHRWLRRGEPVEVERDFGEVLAREGCEPGPGARAAKISD